MANIGGEVGSRKQSRKPVNVFKEKNRRDSGEVLASGTTDIDVETVCGSCLYADDTYKESVTFCLQCSEYLCDKCRSQHMKIKITRSHKLMNIDDKSAVDSSATEECLEHYGKPVNYFCENHHVLCCKSCVDVAHTSCLDVKFIPDEAESIVDSQELKECNGNLEELIKGFVELKKFKQSQRLKIDSQRTTALQHVENLMLTVNRFFDKLVQDSTEEIKHERDTLTKDLSIDEDSYEAVIKTLHETNKHLGMVVKCAGKSQIFITMKKALQQTQKYEGYLRDIESNMKESNMSFQENTAFQTMFNNLTSIGSVSTSSKLTEKAMKSHRSSSLSFQRRKAIPVGGHSVRTGIDKTTCYITGSAFLDDGRLVLADYNNKCMKIFDINCKFRDQKALSSRPNDIAIISQTEVATSLIDENSIQFLHIDKSINLARRIITDAQYFGITCSRQKEIFASCSCKDDSGEIHVLDLLGNIVRKIGNTRKGSPMFVRPTTLKISNDGRLLFVTDIGQNSITCVDATLSSSNSRVIYTYTDLNLKLRNGIAMDQNESIFVSSSNRKIHQISFTGIKIQEILTEKEGLGVPHCLSFSAKNNKLLVAEFKENSIKLFELV